MVNAVRPRRETPKTAAKTSIFEDIAEIGKEHAEELRQSFAGPIVELAIDYLRTNPHNPRTRISPASIEEMVNAIRQVGEVLQPLLVRPIPRDPQGRTYEVVCGNRRLLGAEQAGLLKVPVRVKTLTDDEAAKYAVWENLAREDLSPIDLAESIDKLRRIEHASWSDIAARFGVSRQWAWKQQKIAELPEEIKTMVRDQRLSASHAALLTQSTDARAEMIALAAEIADQRLSKRELEIILQQRSPEVRSNVNPGLHFSWTPPAGFQGRVYSRLNRAVEDIAASLQAGRVSPDYAHSLLPLLDGIRTLAREARKLEERKIPDGEPNQQEHIQSAKIPG